MNSLKTKFFLAVAIFITVVITIFWLPSSIWDTLFATKIKVQDALIDRPWVTVIPNLKPVGVVNALEAKDCGVCHTEIYEEWKSSTHANAFTDIQFQSEIAKPNNPKWLCLNCHIPVANQREELVSYLYNGKVLSPVLEKNPHYIPGFETEGVTCATCHVRSDENGNSYILGAKGNTMAKHPVRVDAEALKNRCWDCHNQTYLVENQLVCYFQTGDELKQSKEHGDKYCSNCHMPEIQRKIVEPSHQTPVRTAHRHGFIGGGVPKTKELFSQQKSLGYKTGVEFSSVSVQTQPSLSKPGHLEVTYKFQMKNNAGHYVTSGDPERHMIIRWMAIDEAGELLSHWDSKIGQEWEWSPKPKLLSDNRLKADETRTQKGSFEVPFELFAHTKTLRLEVRHVRLTTTTAMYMKKTAHQVDEAFREKVKNIQDHYPFSRAIFAEDWEFQKNTSNLRPKKKFTAIELESLPNWEEIVTP